METETVSVKRVWHGRRNLQAIGKTAPDALTAPPSLLDLLCRFRNVQATDPRDKIYALHSLAADRDFVPRVDYSQTVDKVYTQFARYFVKTGKGLQVVVAASLGQEVLGLPSWVPDWTVSGEFRRPFEDPLDSTYGPSAENNLWRDVRLGPRDTAIVIRGTLFKRITGITKPLDLTQTSFYYKDAVEILYG
ncbi:hypothetical protein H2203_008994 [Taxawa tesnikishii (nom. ined.)]|nr:hypothetical protein H2203_008994 [Dothideales sp. JES 119]